MEQLTPGSVKHFATSFRQEDGSLVDPTSPHVLFLDPVGAITTLALVQEVSGQYSLDWTIPDGTTPAVYDFVYAATYAPFEGADEAEWQSDIESFQVVASPSTEPVSAVGLAANAMTTLGAIKEELGISDDDTSADVRLRRMINAASGWIESELHRDLSRATVIEKLRGFGRVKLLLRRYPVVSISIVKLDTVVLEQGDDPGDWDYESQEGGILYREDGWPLVARRYGDLTPDVDPSKARRNVEITYIGGYVLPKDEDDAHPRSLPWEIEWAAIRLVKIWYDRDPDVRKETSPTGYSYEVDPKTAREILRDLRRYRRWV